MLIDVVDAIVKINRHLASYKVQLITLTGTPIATISVSKDSTSYSDVLSWLMMHAPGPRLVLSGDGAGRYVAGLARAVTAAGMTVIESEQPEPAWQLDTERLLSSQAEDDRDALRILLGARQELTTTVTRQSTRLRGLLLAGDDTDRKIARAAFTEATLIGLVRRPQPHGMSRQRFVRHAEIRRLALLLVAVGRDLKANSAQLQAIVDDLVPGLTDQRGIGPINAAQAIVSLSYPAAVPKQRRPPATEATSPL